MLAVKWGFFYLGLLRAYALNIITVELNLNTGSKNHGRNFSDMLTSPRKPVHCDNWYS